MTTDIIMFFFHFLESLSSSAVFHAISRQKTRVAIPAKNEECKWMWHFTYPYIEMVESQSVLLLHWLKLSKFLSSMGYHVYHILFTHSDMLRIRLSHKIEALYPVASICHLTNVPSIFGFSVPYWKLFSFTRFWCLWSWTTIWWMMGILLTPRHLPLLLLC